MDLGEEAVGGQGGEEPDHPLDDLHHLMIMPTKVPMGGVDNDNVGVEMEIPAPEPSLYQIPLLQMMSGTNLTRTPPKTGTKSKHGEVGTDGVLGEGNVGVDKDKAEVESAAVDAGIVGQGAQGEGRRVEAGANPDEQTGKQAKTRKIRCNSCNSCRQHSCPKRTGDNYSCLSCLARQTCVLRPPCEALTTAEAKIWFENVIDKNNGLIHKRPDAIEHVINTIDDQTATVFILPNQVKAKVYPNIEKDLEVDEEENGKEKGRVDFEKKIVNMLQEFKADTAARHASDVDQLKDLFKEHLDKQAKLFQRMVKIKDDTDAGNKDDNDINDCESQRSTGSSASNFKFRPPPSAPLLSPPPIPRSRSTHTPPIPAPPIPAPPGTKHDDAIARLASVLERKFDSPPKPAARLPAFALPPMLLVGGQPAGTSYWAWRAKCIQLFKDNAISDSVALNLLASDKSLPKKWASSISNCTSVEQVFKTLDSQTPSKQSILPNLVKQLTEMSSAFSNDEQLQLCDKLCRILVQLQTFFPERDLTLCELTACLSAFQSQHEISLLPSLLKDFKSQQAATNRKYVDILYDYAKEKRSDLHDILAALNQYRRDDAVNHQNILMNGGRGGGAAGRGAELSGAELR